MLFRLSVLGLSVVLFSGCSTYAVDRYSSSVDNVVALRKLDTTMNVGDFSATEPGETKIMCRGVGPIVTPDQQPFEDYIRGALEDELKLAEVYDANASITLSGNLDNVDFSSASGTWDLELTVESSNGESLSVSESYDFKTSFYGETACNQTAQALMPAVQNLLTSLVTHERFQALAD
jgi:hypothetical protein